VVTVAIESDKQKRKVLGYFTDSPSARRALAEYNDNPLTANRLDITLRELYDEWSGPKYKTISKATAANYRAAWGHVCKKKPGEKCIADMKVRDIRTGNMQQVIDRVAEEKSHSTVHKIRVLFGLLMEYAVMNDVSKKNYAEFLTLPSAEASGKDRFSETELAAIEKAARDGIPFADCVLMMCYTGFRIAEFLGLTRFSYNGEDDTLTGGMKTEAGENRVVPLHPKIKPYLMKWIEKGGQTIICQDNGRPYTTKRFREECYKPCVAALPIRPLMPHECRHTFASLLDSVDGSDKAKAMILGHSDYKISKDVYIHKTLPDLRSIINRLK
jgi:integrase